jgi:branched-chain amino acid transport system permease protein
MITQALVNGIAVGGLYALIAIGFSLVFSILNIINFAHGSLYMIGAAVGVVLHVTAGLPFWLAFLGGLVAAAVAGALVEKLAVAPLRARNAPHISFLISTLGMQLALDTSALLVFGARTRPFPSPIPQRTFTARGVKFTLLEVIIVIVTIAMVMALEVFLRRTRTGKAIRATAQNQMTAGLMGVDVGQINWITFAISAVLGAAAGVFVGVYYNSVYASMGFIAGLKGFTAAVLGGMGSISGAVLGGFLLGIAENLGTSVLGSGLRDITAFAILILVLVVKPAGLLGRARQQRV